MFSGKWDFAEKKWWDEGNECSSVANGCLSKGNGCLRVANGCLSKGNGY